MAQGGTDNPMTISWHDSVWIPVLSRANIMDYFSQETNPFYQRNCNNELIKMQRLNPEHLTRMTGIEYYLLHVQEPILYVIRKQERRSQEQVIPLCDYYIIAGIVYQAPDLGSILNSRLLNSLHYLMSAFKEAHSYARYHPSKGYTWDFKDDQFNKKTPSAKVHKKEEPSSIFQRQRVDELLNELTAKFPPKVYTASQEIKPPGEAPKIEIKPEVKTEKPEEPSQLAASKPPPEKKPRTGR